MNITLSVDDIIVREARKVAGAMGTSVNQLVRDYLKGLAQKGDVERDLEELQALTEAGHGRARGWRFNRDELHGRP
ncbi:MAG: hypothetical protein Q8N53_03060 [Longimicrobiales bacterium]|nr:hypothetical protein [Longimicrobiales bacterium]